MLGVAAPIPSVRAAVPGSPRIRLCMVVNNLDVGGLEKVVISLLQTLPRERFELYLVCLSGPGKLFDEIDLPPSHCLVLDRRQEMTSLGDRAKIAAHVWKIRSFLREQAIDIVHTHNLAPLLLAGAAARTLRRRPAVVYSEHNQIHRSDEFARKKFRQYARLADELIAVSHDLERTLAQKLRVPRPVRVIHNGIDGKRFADVDGAAVRRELGFGDDVFVVGTAVVLSEQKGITYLLEAAKRVAKVEPSIRIVVAGDGPLRKDLEKEARDAQLDGVVRFIGYRRDIPQLIASFDTYVLPSLWEGLPLALLEALALGKPIVATTVGGNPEVVEDAQNGLLVPPKDPEALAQALLRVARDKSLRDAIRARNVERFRTKFSLESMTAAHTHFFTSLLDARA